MPPYIKWIARCGNGLLIVFFALVAVFGGDIGVALMILPMIAFLGFNIYVIEKCARLLG